MRKLLKKKTLAIVAICVGVVLVALFAHFYLEAGKEIDAYRITDEQVLQRVKKHLIVPDEKPVIYTVTDPNLLKLNQDFFKDAEQNDKMLIFQEQGLAVIYGVQRDIIVNVGPMNFKNSSGVEQKSGDTK